MHRTWRARGRRRAPRIVGRAERRRLWWPRRRGRVPRVHDVPRRQRHRGTHAPPQDRARGDGVTPAERAREDRVRERVIVPWVEAQRRAGHAMAAWSRERGSLAERIVTFVDDDVAAALGARTRQTLFDFAA